MSNSIAPVLLTPRFSEVPERRLISNRLSGFPARAKTAKAVKQTLHGVHRAKARC